MTTLDRARIRLMRLGRTHLKHFRQRAGSRVLGAHQRQAFFVTGVQRSGTNMVMDLFEADMGTEVFHETDSRAFHNYELRSFDVLSRLVDETAAPITIFKALL